MNNRIEELMLEAGYAAPALAGRAIKLVDLIVNEFDIILANEFLDCIGNKDKKSEKRIERLRDRIKTHFKVKE